MITLKDSIEVKAAPEELFETISEQPAIFSCGWPGADRLRFGSDMPFGLVHVRVVTYDMPLDGEVTRGKNARIIGGSIPELFGLAGK